jgi:hypothetical protein
MIPEIVSGWVTSVTIGLNNPALPTTHIEIWSGSGAPVTVVTPGANGAPPVVVAGVPAVHVGERWQFLVTDTPRGWVPLELGVSMARLDGPVPPPWAVNGLTYPAERLPLGIWMTEGGSSALGAELSAAIVREALAAWTEVGCSDFEYVYEGTIDAGFGDDGLNVLSWEDETWTWGDGVLGMTATRFELMDGLPSPAGADILFNGVDYLWVEGVGDLYVTPATVNAGSVVTHELGHVAGMDHSYTDVAATMFFAYISGDWQRTVSGDDRRGLCETYNNGRDECTTDAACAPLDANGMAHYCREIDGIGVCDEVRSPVGSACARTFFNCAEACIFINPMATAGYCSTFCDSDDDCEVGFSCGVPGGVFLYDDPTIDDQTLCVRHDTPDTGVPPEDTGVPPEDTGAPPEDTGVGSEHVPPPEMVAKSGGCGCTSGRARPKPLLVFVFLLGLIGRARTMTCSEESP